MGNLRERGTPFLGTRVTFASAYPTVEKAYVSFTETDCGSNPQERIHSLVDGPRAACGNPYCERGGYDFELIVMEMVRQGVETKPVEFSCNGDEGTPGGRRKGKSCLMSMSGDVTIRYKPLDPPKENNDSQIE